MERSMNRRAATSPKNAGKRGERLPIDVYDEPGHLIRRAQQISVSMFHSTMRNGVTPIQYCVLRVLQDHPGIDQVTLARLCALDTSTAADLAVRLEERGLVRRMMPMKSRRYRVLHITPEAEAVLKRLIPSASVLSQRLLQELDKQEQKIFMRLLRKFVHLNNEKSRAPLDREGAGARSGHFHSSGKRA
jgi:DNA-binding MarR family transcriptional regulator